MEEHNAEVQYHYWITDNAVTANMTNYVGDESISILAYNITHDAIAEINMSLSTARSLLKDLTEQIEWMNDNENLYSPAVQRSREITRRAWERHPNNNTPRIS